MEGWLGFISFGCMGAEEAYMRTGAMGVWRLCMPGSCVGLWKKLGHGGFRGFRCLGALEACKFLHTHMEGMEKGDFEGLG